MPAVTISSAGLRVMRLLVGSRPQTVTELIRATGVTRTAVTEQLNELVGAGFVNRTVEKLSSRGRPRHLYAATTQSLLMLFPGHQHLLVPAVWQAIDEIGGPELTEKVLQGVSRKLAEHYSKRITAKQPHERLEHLVELMREEGVLLEATERNGHAGVEKRSCPFLCMVDENFTVCALDIDIMTTIVGKPVRQTACRHKGAPCCRFEIDAENGL